MIDLNRKPLFRLAAGAVCLFFILCSCTPEKQELSPEETHRLCEQYADDLNWLENYPEDSYYHPLSFYAPLAKEHNVPLCLFEIVSVKRSDDKPLDGIKKLYRFDFDLLVKEAYGGNDQLKGKVLHQYSYQKNEDSSALIGKKYIGYLSGENTECKIHTFWTFLITKDDILVCPFGCPAETPPQDSYEAIMESRNYTGQPLHYFLEMVQAAETQAAKD